MKTAIVCEGGGMRGVYTAGVLQAFMEEGFAADLLVGVSAGASNGVSYVSGQKGRGYRTNVDYAADDRYCSVRSLLKTGSLFGMDFIFGEIPEHLDPLDYDAFYASSCAFFAGVTDVETGRAVFFGKEKILPGLAVIRASCSLPVLSPMVTVEGRQYLDGGVAAPIPFEKALKEGCDRMVVVLTRPLGYRKKPQRIHRLFRAVYRDYPHLVRAIALRHLVYNHQLERLRRLEQKGIAVVVAPPKALAVDRFGKDTEELIHSYHIGTDCGRAALARL